MKKTSSLLAVLAVLSTLPAFPLRADNVEFSHVMKAADSYALRRQSDIALAYYRQALQKAQTDGERALAQLGIARNTPVRAPGEADDQAGVKKNAEFLKVLALPQASAASKADAQLGMARVQAEIGRFESAATLLAQVEAMPDAGADQKFRAQNWRGQILIEQKQYDQAYVVLTDYMARAPLDQDGKIEAWRHLAHIHLARSEGEKAKETLAKTVAFDGLKDNKIADIRIANGDFLSARGFDAAARGEYAQVAVLTEADVAKSVLARFQIGRTYFREKNYAAARATWTPMVEMRGAEKHLPALWKAIGQSHEQEKEYSQARAAYEQWLAVPGLETQNKVGAWQAIANTHVLEKNYAAAREVLGNIGRGAVAGSDLYLQQQFDVAEVYRAENDFAGAAARYVDALNSVAQHYAALSSKPTVYYTVQDVVWKAVHELEKEPAAQTAAYTIYEALEKHYPYEKQKADAFLGMGDLLLAQGRREEAKAKYEKALELRKNYDEGKIAAEKLKALAEKNPAGG